MAGDAFRSGVRRHLRLARVLTVAALGWTACGDADGATLFAQAGQALVAPGLDQAAKPVAAQPPEVTPPGAAGEEAAAGAERNLGFMKYGPSYALVVLFVGLGTFIVCRPPRAKPVAK